MASNASVILKFSDGSISYLRNDITLDSFTEVLTDASGLVNQAGGISAGQANQGKLLTHAAVKCQLDNGTTGSFSAATIVGVGGNIIGLIQGGGVQVSGLPKLKRPIRMETGIKINVFGQTLTSGDTLQYATLAVYCASGKCDVFQGLAVDATDVPMLSAISGSTLGQALVGERVMCYYATYPATNGLADVGIADGVNAFFAEDAQGQLKSMMFPSYGQSSAMMTEFVEDSFTVVQNDTLTVRANV
jgi:hypothetical protein